MAELLHAASQYQPQPAGAGAFVLSRLPHPDTAAADAPAFLDAAAGTLSFSALRRAALSLASGLRLGLGLRRGDAVLLLSPNSLLLPQIVLGVLAAGGVVVAADPDATPAEIAAAAHASGAVMVVAAPEAAARAAAAGVPLLLTSRSPDPRALSAEELIEGGDPAALAAAADPDDELPPRLADVAFVAYSSATRTAAMTHADLVAAVAAAASPGDRDGRVCLASLPVCSAHGLPLLALALPAAGVTTVLVPPTSDPRAAREAVLAHGATDVVAGPEAAAALAGPVPLDGSLASLRRVTVAPTPLTAEAREDFRRRLPWVQLTELMPAPSIDSSASGEQLHHQLPVPVPVPVAPPQTDAKPLTIQQNSQSADQVSATTEAASPVPPLKKIQKMILGDIFSRSTTSNILRKHPAATTNIQALSKL